MTLLMAGILFGVIGVWAVGRSIESVLFGVPAFHLTILFATAFVMAATSLVACFIPARRASCVDPMIALRAE
jgi:putative ABC transport system permease protein